MYGCESWAIKKAEHRRIDALICGVGEDSWESLGLQGDLTSLPWRKSILNTHWKDWCWSWSSHTLVTWCEELSHWKEPDAGKDWRQEKRATEDEMVGWHHRLNGHEFQQTLGDGEGQGSPVCCSPRGHKESDTIEWLNNSDPGCQVKEQCHHPSTDLNNHYDSPTLTSQGQSPARCKGGAGEASLLSTCAGQSSPLPFPLTTEL